MEIKIDYFLWNKENEICFFKTLKITESDIQELMLKKYQDGELPCPSRLSKDEITPEFSISNITV